MAPKNILTVLYLEHSNLAGRRNSVSEKKKKKRKSNACKFYFSLCTKREKTKNGFPKVREPLRRV
jgi:hypothetical protein